MRMTACMHNNHVMCVRTWYCIQMKTSTKPDGTAWCYKATEKVVHRKGGLKAHVAKVPNAWLMRGSSSRCVISSQAVDGSALCQTPEQKNMIKTGKVPNKLKDKMNLCYIARVFF